MGTDAMDGRDARRRPTRGSANVSAKNTLFVAPWLVTCGFGLVLVLALWHANEQREAAVLLHERLERAENRLATYESLQPRVDNPPWQEEIEAVKQKRLAHEVSEEFTDELFATANRFPHGHNLTSWEAMLDRTTPSAFADDGTTEDAPASWCTDLAQVVISEAELSQQPLTPSTRDRASATLPPSSHSPPRASRVQRVYTVP